LELCDKMQVQYKKRELEFTLLATGSVFSFYSTDADEGQKIKGAKRDFLFCNEANELTSDDWTQLIIRTNKVAIIDYNPSITDEHWLNSIKIKPSTFFFKTTYLDNPFLPQVIIDSIEELKTINKSLWTIYGLGEQAIIEGVVFKNWQIIDELPPQIRGHKLGMDFGFSNDPTTIIDVAQNGNNLFLDELCYQTHMTTSEIISALKDCPRYKVVAESADPRLISEIYNAGIDIHPAKKGAGSIEAGILVMQSMNIYVTKRSENIIKELKNYTYKQDKDGKWLTTPIDAYNHCIDPTRYVLMDDYGYKKTRGLQRIN
jgi:phage terminase large subunit